MTSYTNKSDWFPELDLEILKVFANEAVKQFSDFPITRVLLYHYTNEYFPHKSIATKYAMIFDVDLDPEPDIVDPLVPLAEHHGIDVTALSLCDIRCAIQNRHDLISEYEKFKMSIGYQSTIKNHSAYSRLKTKELLHIVYRENIPDNYLNEWTFIPELRGQRTHPGVMVDVPCLILFEKAEPQNHEDIIKALTLQYENDESIIIKYKLGNKKTFRYDDRNLKFKNNRTKEWTFLLRVLNSNQPIKVNEYERRWMRKVEEKLKNLIGNLDNIDIPKDYELFYYDKTDDLGCYRTRFNTSLSSQNITFIDKGDFMEQFSELLNLIETKKADASTEATFFKLLELGKKNKWLSHEMYAGALEKYKIASASHGEIENIPRATAIKRDPDVS